MSKIELFHGSDHIIEKPNFHLGKTNNDYGRGFYCTQQLSMSMEWACKQNTDGFVNKYFLEQNSLNILNLLDGNYNILHWMALLLVIEQMIPISLLLNHLFKMDYHFVV